MRWLIEFLTSSIGKKLVMSLTGLFLISFLTVHLIGNLQLLYNDGGESFNVYAKFMTSNPLIKFISIGLYFFILLHAVLGIYIALRNRKAKGQNYAVTTYANGSWMSKNMALLGSLVFIFLCIHLGDFWYKMKFTEQLTMITYDGVGYEVKDLYAQVKTKFSQEWVVIIYLIGVVALMLHLIHGFQSAFQSLGINHKKYTPLIKLTGIAYSILITIGYASIPIYMLIRSANTY